MTDLIQKQIEFYLSDQNLKNDRFFNKTIKAAENRMIPIKTLFSCKRIQHLKATEEDLI